MMIATCPIMMITIHGQVATCPYNKRQNKNLINEQQQFLQHLLQAQEGITWLKDKSLADLDNLPDPDVLALEIVENLEAGLESFKAIIASLNTK